MATRLSASQQRNGVSEGIALGFCILGRTEFRFDKLRIDLAFERAWRDWPDRYRSQYPQVSTDLRNGSDAVWKMLHASHRSRVFALYWDWESPGPITIYARQDDWDPEDPDDVDFAVSVISGDVPADGWVLLARTFLEDFDRQYEQD
ncbi:hypothetical protein ACN27E_07920 [Mycobacterium sp. WMMD1722]|uniref:hypothetical protein n=1 Tax=Mycobacterium sp. WMMD1722 TaxID=3404117 RepID=UPI003BF59467